jgi:hypothetical protein
MYYFVNHNAIKDNLPDNWVDFCGKYANAYFSCLSPRLGSIDSPLPMVVLPELVLPQYEDKFNKSFADITNQTAIELKNKIHQTGNPAVVLYSGGIDSTLVVSAILKNFSSTELDLVNIILSDDSIKENPEFYAKFICPNFNILSFNDYSLDDLFDLNYTIVTGIGGDEIFGPQWPEYTIRFFRDIIRSPYKQHQSEIERYFAFGASESFGKWFYQQIDQNITETKIPIESVFDFFWWKCFNLKTISMALTNLVMHTTVEPKKSLKQLNHWFLNQDYQLWSMARNEVKTQIDPLIHKFPAKQYIYDLDKNELYYKYKIKTSSFSLVYPEINNNVFALDQNYNRINLTDIDIDSIIKQRNLIAPVII